MARILIFMIPQLLQELDVFEGREEGLRGIMRYSLYSTVYYRSSDFTHSKRVAWLVESLEPIITEKLPNFDMVRAVATALAHDDAELLIGDIQAGNKGKMSKEELQAIDDAERKAIDALADKFPKTLGGYNYKDMLEDVLDFTTPEAQVVKYIDRFDALGEALHELYAGNVVMNTPVVNEYGTIPTPFEYYYTKLPQMMEQYQALGALKNTHPFFEIAEVKDWARVVAESRPHTKESFAAPAGHKQYDVWKKVLLENADEETLNDLLIQKEFAS